MDHWIPTLVAVTLSMATLATPQETKTQDATLHDSAPFTSAIVCGQCHKDIYEAWSQNIHSRAATEPIFARALQEAEMRLQDEARPFCLTCHAPTTVKTQDYDVSRVITKESVTCDFCHTMVASKPNAEVPFELDVGGRENIKRGPYRDADPKDHGVAFSELHLSAKLCASCHEYTNPAGVAILSTYSEYLDGPYPHRNVACQGCHMPVVMANVVDPKVKPAKQRVWVNLHRLPGGHARDQLRRAMELRWTEIERSAGRIQVGVSVENIGAGHKVPTGMPTRKLVLEVEAQVDDDVFREGATFEKVVVDTEGKRILKDGEMFTEAASIRRDNRIAPGEKRNLRFSFLVPSGRQAELTARLVYEFAPLGPDGETERIPFLTIKRTGP